MPKDWHNRKKTASRRDYSRRRYGNPLFKHATSRPKAPKRLLSGNLKYWIFGGMATVAVVAVLWYLFWSTAFRIAETTVEGASAETESVISDIVATRLEERGFLGIPYSSFFLFDEDALRREIDTTIFLGQLDIRKKWPDGIVVSVGERDVSAVLVSGNRFLAVDRNGTVVRELTQKETRRMADLPSGINAVMAGELGTEVVNVNDIVDEAPDPNERKRNLNPYPLLVRTADMREDGLKPGDHGIPEETLSLILQSHAHLPDLTGSGVRWFVVDPSEESVEAVLRSGWSVFLSRDTPFDLQGERLTLVLREKIGKRSDDLDYIDLRYGERIFFRYKAGLEGESAE